MASRPQPGARAMVTLADIERARERLQGVTRRTPLIRSYALSRRLGCDVFLKAEMLQRTGSFKLRGAYNKIAQLAPADRERGVIAASAGNHAQGVAVAASLAGYPRQSRPDGWPSRRARAERGATSTWTCSPRCSAADHSRMPRRRSEELAVRRLMTGNDRPAPVGKKRCGAAENAAGALPTRRDGLSLAIREHAVAEWGRCRPASGSDPRPCPWRHQPARPRETTVRT